MSRRKAGKATGIMKHNPLCVAAKPAFAMPEAAYVNDRFTGI